jgi:hypothetical protein
VYILETLEPGKMITDLIQSNLEKIVGKTYQYGHEKFNELKVSTSIAFKQYLQFSVNKYSNIKTILYRDVPVNIKDYYVHTDVLFKKKSIKVDKITTITDISNFLIVTGTAGAGKSTFMKYLFLETILNKYKIPIFLELRHLNNTDSTIEDYLYETLVIGGFDLERKFLLNAFTSGRFCVFLDGFDEIDYDRKNDITIQIQKFADKFNQNNFILSSRPDSSFISWSNFTELRLQPLTKDKSIELIKKLDYDTDVKVKFLSQLDSTFYIKNREFISNPLLLTIMLMTFNQFAEVPDKMHLFYEQAFDTLYNKHDATKTGYKRVMASNLAKDEFQYILSCFSFISFMKGDISFNSYKLNHYFEQVKKLVNINFDEDEYLNDLIKSVCIFLQDGLLYTFTHRTFQEYFTAKYLIGLNDELLKKFLPTITKKMNTDKVFNILFELNKNKIEDLYIIPKLNELKESIKFDFDKKGEAYRNYLQLMFKDISIHAHPIDGDYDNIVTLTRKYDENRIFSELVSFVNSKYPDLDLGMINGANLTPEEIIDKYFDDEFSESETVYLTEELDNDTFFNDIFSEADGLAKPLFKSMKWLEIMGGELKQEREDVFSILLTNN